MCVGLIYTHRLVSERTLEWKQRDTHGVPKTAVLGIQRAKRWSGPDRLKGLG